MHEQSGRSMLEMLGVLGIIGIISVGAVGIIGKALQSHRNTEILNDAVYLATKAAKTACESEGYESFTDLIHKSGLYSSNLTFDSSNKNFTGVDDVTYEITKIGGKESVATAFVLKIGALSDEQCLTMALADWGSERTSGYLGINVNKDLDITVEDKTIKNADGTNSSPITTSTAASSCNKGQANVLQILYRGCKFAYSY